MNKLSIKVLFIIIAILSVFTILLKVVLQENVSVNESYFKKQWYLRNEGQKIESLNGVRGVDINLETSLRLSKEKNTIAIIDSGVNFGNSYISHSEFNNYLEIPDNYIDDDNNGYIDDYNGWDFYNNDNLQFDPETEDFHGTAIAGIIAGRDKK